MLNKYLMKNPCIAVLLLSLAVFSACNTLNSSEEKGFIIGEVYDVYQDDKQMISGADIVLEGEILAKTDEHGIFKLNLKKGKYNLRIESEYHEAFKLNFKVDGEQSKVLDIELTPVFVDYFPLAEGYEWHYSYSGFGKDGHQDNLYKGSRKLLINEVITEGDDILYSYIISDSTTSYLDYDSWDSENEQVIRVQDTITVQKSYSALIREKSNGQLVIESEINPFFALGNEFISWDEKGSQIVTPLRRYLPISRFKEKFEIMAGGTTVYPGYVEVQAGKGVVSAGEYGGHIDTYSKGYILESTNFVKPRAEV